MSESNHSVSWPSPSKPSARSSDITRNDDAESGTSISSSVYRQQQEFINDKQIQMKNSSSSPPLTAKSARNFWLSKQNQPKGAPSWKKYVQPSNSSEKSKHHQQDNTSNNDNVVEEENTNDTSQSIQSPEKSDKETGNHVSERSSTSRSMNESSFFQKSLENFQKKNMSVTDDAENEIESTRQNASRSKISKNEDRNKGDQSYTQSEISNDVSNSITPSPPPPPGKPSNSTFQKSNQVNTSSSISLNDSTRSSKYHRRDDSFLRSNKNSQNYNNQDGQQSFNQSISNKSRSQHSLHQSSNVNVPTISHESTPAKTSHTLHDDGAVGEMQIKLDIAAAKLLTEEMKYKDVQEKLSSLEESLRYKIEKLQRELMEQKRINEEKEKENERKYLAEERQRSEEKQKRLEESQTREEQQREVDELYMEIERLHESHRNERVLAQNKEREMKEKFSQKESEIESILEQLDKAQGTSDESGLGQDDLTRDLAQKEEELHSSRMEVREIKKEVKAITQDFKDLADETERLEIELEAVTEDRDELLRRSVLYQNQSSQSQSDSMTRGGQSTPNGAHLQTEIEKLRFMLQEQEVENKLKDKKIEELEAALDNETAPSRGKSFELDLSAIDVVENISQVVEDKDARRELELHFRNMEQEVARLKRERDSFEVNVLELQTERDNLKECLADAMNELECNEEAMKASETKANAVVQELMDVIKEKDAEIEILTEQIGSDPKISQYTSNSTAESFQEDYNNVVEWLDSSTRLNGSPSIEMMMVKPLTNIKLPPEDEAFLQKLHRSIKEVHLKWNQAENELKRTKKMLISFENSYEYEEEKAYETSTEASFERGGPTESSTRYAEIMSTREADDAVSTLKYYFKQIRDEANHHEKVNKDLRQSLSEAADLIKPLNDHVQRIEQERLDLQSELAATTKNLMELQKFASNLSVPPPQSKASSSLSQNNSFNDCQFVQISAFDLRKKEDEIVSLKIEVNHLKKELVDVKGNLKMVGGDHDFVEMPTPTKSNRGRDKRIWDQDTMQSANEEDDTMSRILHSEIDSLKRDLKKKISAEETLKVILRDSSNRLNLMSTQAEQLASEKSQAENHIKKLEREKIGLQEQLDKLSQTMTDNQSPSEELIQLHEKNDQYAIQIAQLEIDVKSNSKERKKLKKSLAEAVGMLNALRKHVESSEKERKKLKKHIRSLHTKNDVQNTENESPSLRMKKSPNVNSNFDPDPDKMENETTILNLKSVVVELEHEIRLLEERIDEFEVSNPNGETLRIDNGDKDISKTVKSLQERLKEEQNAHKTTASMLDEVAEINKEMLNDLRQTEEEAAEAVNELDALRKKFNQLKADLEDSKYVASFLIQKLEGSSNNSADLYGDLDDLPLADCINRIDRLIQNYLATSFKTNRNHASDGW